MLVTNPARLLADLCLASFPCNDCGFVGRPMSVGRRCGASMSLVILTSGSVLLARAMSKSRFSSALMNSLWTLGDSGRRSRAAAPSCCVPAEIEVLVAVWNLRLRWLAADLSAVPSSSASWVHLAR